MTPKCIKRVERLEAESTAFAELSVEQLLYAAIKGSGLDDVRHVLDTTDWDKWAKEEK